MHFGFIKVGNSALFRVDSPRIMRMKQIFADFSKHKEALFCENPC